jgi:threonine/homoserine/homoserine lactone efflux protein
MIETGDLIAFLVAALLMAVTPGNDVMFITSQSVGGGARVGAAAAMGVSIGMLFHIGALALGLSELLVHWPWLLRVIKVAGAGYLLWLAIRAFRAKGLQLEAAEGGNAFRKGILTNILNPKMSLFCLAFIPQFVDPERGAVWAQLLFLGGCFAISGTLVNLAYALLFGNAFARVAHNRRFQRVASRTTGVIFMGLAARILI